VKIFMPAQNPFSEDKIGWHFVYEDGAHSLH
jgi:hypothetical protein